MDIVWALSIGRRKAIALGKELDERAQARKAAGSVTTSGSMPTDDPSTGTNTGTWSPDTEFGPGRRGTRW